MLLYHVLKVLCAPKRFDSEFPIIKTTKLGQHSHVHEQSEFNRSGEFVAAK